MKLFSFRPGVLKGFGLGLVVGAFVISGASFNWVDGFGFGAMLPSTAQKLVNAEVVKLYTPVCVAHFEHQANMPTQWASWKKIDEWSQTGWLSDHKFATPTGMTSPNEDVANACASQISKDMPKLKTASTS